MYRVGRNNTVIFLRYQVSWQTGEFDISDDMEETYNKDIEFEPESVTWHKYFETTADKNEFVEKLYEEGATNIVVEEIDQSHHDWLLGIEFNNFDEILMALNDGEQAYRHHLFKQNINLQHDLYLAEIDFRLSLLERGI